MDKRRYKRRHLIYYLRVFSQQTNELVGHLIDLTQEGLMLISESALETGKDYAFFMNLPVENLGKDRLEFKARCVWTKRDINPSFFAMGFHLTEIDPADVEIIHGLIDEFGFQD